MKPIESLRNSLRSMHEGPAWYGTSMREILAEITATEADIRPDSRQAKTIWEHVGHILTGKDVTRRRISGELPSAVSESQNWPVVHDRSEANGKAILDRLEASHAALFKLLEPLTPEDLDRKIDGASAPYSMDFAIRGLAQHDADHAGQIAMITKAIRPSSTPRIASDV